MLSLALRRRARDHRVALGAGAREHGLWAPASLPVASQPLNLRAIRGCKIQGQRVAVAMRALRQRVLRGAVHRCAHGKAPLEGAFGPRHRLSRRLLRYPSLRCASARVWVPRRRDSQDKLRVGVPRVAPQALPRARCAVF
eukprot:Amastigsp_a342338_7.p2 type:complete len:140 gc:universal Amastigsp_a342338_7:795-376(-)